MSDYPRMLYRDGTQKRVWGVQVDTMKVGTAEEEAQARADGWRGSPLAEAITEEDASTLQPSSEAGSQAAELRTQLDEANDTIADLRAQVEELTGQIEALTAPAAIDVIESAVAGEAETFSGDTLSLPTGYKVREVKVSGRKAKESADAAAG